MQNYAWFVIEIFFDRRCFRNEWEFIPIDEFHIEFRMTHRNLLHFSMNFRMDSFNVTNGQTFPLIFGCWTIADVLHFRFDSVQLNGRRLVIGNSPYNQKYGIFFFVFCIVRMRVGHFVITHVTCAAFDNTVGLKISNIRPSNRNRKNKHSEHSSLNERINERTSKFCSY